MKLDFSKLPLIIIIMAITIPMGVKAIVIGNFISTFICYFINAYLPGKLFNFGIKAQFRIFYKIAIATSFMAIAVWGTMALFNMPIIKLTIGIIAGIISYLIISSLLRIEELKQIIELICLKINKKINP